MTTATIIHHPRLQQGALRIAQNYREPVELLRALANARAVVFNRKLFSVGDQLLAAALLKSHGTNADRRIAQDFHTRRARQSTGFTPAWPAKFGEFRK